MEAEARGEPAAPREWDLGAASTASRRTRHPRDLAKNLFVFFFFFEGVSSRSSTSL